MLLPLPEWREQFPIPNQFLFLHRLPFPICNWSKQPFKRPEPKMLQPPRTEDAEENSKYSRDHHLLYGRYFRPEIKNDKIKWNDNYIWQQIMCDCHSTNIRQWLQQFSCCIAAKQMQNNGYIHYINPPLPGNKILAAWCIN